MPERTKVKGDLFHGCVSEGDIYVGRAAPGLPESPYANRFALKRQFDHAHYLRPYLNAAVLQLTDGVVDSKAAFDVITPGTARVSVTAYRLWLHDQPELMDEARRELRGKNLACWCPLPAEGEPDICHAAVLLKIANEENANA